MFIVLTILAILFIIVSLKGIHGIIFTISKTTITFTGSPPQGFLLVPILIKCLSHTLLAPITQVIPISLKATKEKPIPPQITLTHDIIDQLFQLQTRFLVIAPVESQYLLHPGTLV